MDSIEIDLDTVIPRIEVRDGRRVMILDDGHAEVVCRLPERDPWRPIQRLGFAADRLRDEVRQAANGDVHRGGKVIAAPDPELHGPLTGPGAFRPIPRPLGPLLVQQDPPGWT